jgi:hypothetical protein
MSNRSYYNRYQDFTTDGQFKIVPGINLPIKTTDKYVVYKKNKTRLDKISDETYGTPLFGWLILIANPSAGSLEFQIPDNYILRIPNPLISSLQDYKRDVELYKLYYGE